MSQALMEPGAQKVARVTMTRAAPIDTVEALVNGARAIVVGVVGPTVRQWVPPGSPDPSPAPGEEAPTAWVVLARDFQVESVLKGEIGPDRTLPLTYLVEMPGALPVVEYDARPLAVGKRYLLFLDESPTGDIWFAAGGPQGEFEVDDDRLRMMTTCYATGLDLHGRSLDESRAFIHSLIERP